MKGPSLDAIRKFKEAQERKKREEDERRVQEKLSTLQHRASQGDRKAKTELKKIEQIKEERAKAPSNKVDFNPHSSHMHYNSSSKNGQHSRVTDKTLIRPKQKEADFEELMKLAKQNNNEMRPPKPHEPAKPVSDKKPIKKMVKEELPRIREPTVQKLIRQPQMQPVNSRLVQPRPMHPKMHTSATVIQRQPAPSYSRMRRYEQDDDDEPDDDYYEDDGFVVDEDEDEAREELQRTLKSVFRYDRRRGDLREEELDRQYRAIGKVTTFEDLEREERRASRLAALEDARAQREEEERKRLKKIRLNKG